MSLILKELEIKKHPLLKTDGKLKFSDGINLFVGKNGSGKTKLLQLTRDCIALNFNNEQELELELLLEDTENNIHCCIRYKQSFENSDTRPALIKSLLDSQKTVKVDYCNLALKSEKQTVFIEYPEGNLKLIDSNGEVQYNYKPESHSSFFITNLALDILQQNPKLIFSLRLLLLSLMNPYEIFHEDNKYFVKFFKSHIQVKFNKDGEFDNSFFDRIADPSTNLLYKQKLEEALENSIDDITPDLISNIIIELNKDNSTTINDISNNLNYKSISLKSPEPLKKTEDSGDVTFTWRLENSRFNIELDEGNTIDYSDLSYGEKRYTLLLLYLAVNNNIFLDEPINGLHHSMIEDVMKKLANDGKQSFIANQSPILFDYVEFDSEEQVHDSIITCRKEGKKLVFSNPSKEMTSRFYEDYQNDFLHVHEILKNHGLW